MIIANKELLQKQQNCIDLLEQITQDDIPNQQLNELGHNYDIIANSNNYKNPIIVKYYGNAVKAGLVQPKGTAFSNSVGQLLKEAALLQKILLDAIDYKTFLSTAAYARVNVNEGQFLQVYIQTF